MAEAAQQPSSESNTAKMEDSQRIAQERMQKLNVVMDHLGFHGGQQRSTDENKMKQQRQQQQPQKLDAASLLSSKDIEGLRASVLNQPPDSYILAGARWMYRSVRASLHDWWISQAPQFPSLNQQQRQQQQQQNQHGAPGLHPDLTRQEQEELDEMTKRKKMMQQFPVSQENRRWSKELSPEEVALLHPRVQAVREEILDMEKRTHDTLDRVWRARFKFLTLAPGEPPCFAEMNRVADCYAQIASLKYEMAVKLEEDDSTPEVIRRQQEGEGGSRIKNPARKSGSFSSSKDNNNSNKKKKKKEQNGLVELPEDLLSMHEVVKMSTSVLACREASERLSQCTDHAGLQHVEKNHGKA